MQYTQLVKSTIVTINERREQIHSMLSKGTKGYEIAKELNVDPFTVSRDIQYLTGQSNTSLYLLVKETMPFMYNTDLMNP